MIPVGRPLLGEKEITAATEVLRSGQVVQGRQVAEFEAEFAGLIAGRHCVAVSAGTAAAFSFTPPRTWPRSRAAW